MKLKTENEKWEKYDCGDEEYDKRFDYFRLKTIGKDAYFYKRECKEWYEPTYDIGEKLEFFIYNLHKKIGPDKNVNPYCVEPYLEILSWIRKNITFD